MFIDGAEVDRVGAARHPGRADQTAEQRVRRARGQPEEPGDQVPHDRPDQPREDDDRVDQRLVDQAAGDGLRDLDRQERARPRSGTAAWPRRSSGRSAPVAIDVAIALAVSWKPFVKSKARAVTTTTMTISGTSMSGTLRSAGDDLGGGVSGPWSAADPTDGTSPASGRARTSRRGPCACPSWDGRRSVPHGPAQPVDGASSVRDERTESGDAPGRNEDARHPAPGHPQVEGGQATGGPLRPRSG